MQQYSYTMALQKGVDNQLQFQFLNQDQKPVDTTDKTIIFRLLNGEGTEILLEKALEPVYSLNGIMVLRTTPSELINIPEQRALYSLEIPVGEFNFPVYMDQNSRARGEINIMDSILPRFVPSLVVPIPTNQVLPWANTDIGAPEVTYRTGIIASDDHTIATIQAKFAGYSGEVVIQGSTNPMDDWYDIATHVYEDLTGTVGYVIEGVHPYLRVEFRSGTGTVSDILAR